MIVCERCGAGPKEASLSVSHAPQQAFAKAGNFANQKNCYVKYCLCQRCHAVYSKIERKIFLEACENMKKAHEEYINQPDIRKEDK